MMWGFIVVVCLIGVIALTAVAIGEDKDNGRRYRQRIARTLTKRADEQNEAALRDEPLGTYGEYMPPEELR